MAAKKEKIEYYWNHEGYRYYIHPTHTITTPIVETNYIGHSHAPPIDNTRKKYLSDASQTKIKKVINLLLQCSKEKWVWEKATGKRFKFKVSFITLTLPSKQIHSDREIVKQVLEPFIRVMRNTYNMGEYMWKAETQDNDNLHFHLTTNIFIHYSKLRYEWNKAVERLGYVSRSGIEEPNSTDVHAVRNVKNLGGYLCGYIAKKDQYKATTKKIIECYRKTKVKDEFQYSDGATCVVDWKRVVESKLWDCSNNLKNRRGLEFFYLFNGRYEDFWYDVTKAKEVLQEVAEVSTHYKDSDFCQVIFHDRKKWESSIHLKKLHEDYISTIRKEGCQQTKYVVDKL